MDRTLLWVAVLGLAIGGGGPRVFSGQRTDGQKDDKPGAAQKQGPQQLGAADKSSTKGSNASGAAGSGSTIARGPTIVRPPWYGPGSYPYAYPYPYPYPYPYNAYPYRPYYGYGYGYGYPPLILPAETIFGPQAAQQFLGTDTLAGSGVGAATGGGAGTAPAAPGGTVGAADVNRTQRATNPDALQRGKRMIDFGDNHFSNGRYSDALDRYRSAAEAAPALSAAVFRQGFALVAQKRYDQATRAFKRGLEIEPTWAQSEFTLNEVYAHHLQAKPVHLDALAAAAGADPGNADLLFLVGLYLYFDGKRERAAPLFERAAQLSPGMPALKGFMETGK